MRSFTGYLESGFSEKDIYFKRKQNIPSSFLDANCGEVFNQGSNPWCAAYTVKTMVESQLRTVNNKVDMSVRDLYCKRSNYDKEGMIPRDCFNILKEKGVTTNKVDMSVRDLYCKRSNYDKEGMIPRDCFNILKEKGVTTNKGLIKILSYQRIGNIEDIKEALIVNGPVFLALPVFIDNEISFWKGNTRVGGHAISLVAFDDLKNEFTLKNSYGSSWNGNGFVNISYEDLNKSLLEAWTCEVKLM